MICTFRIRAAVPLALLLTSTPLFAQGPKPFAEAQLRVQIESPRYARRLGQNLPQLRKVITDSLRAMLTDRFPFIEWRTTNESNLLDITFRGSEGREQYLYLDISAQAPNRDTVITRFEFENEVIAAQRREWTNVNVAVAAWSRTLRTLFAEKEQSIVAAIGRLPLPTAVTLRPRELRAVLALNADRLSASPRSPLVFRVEVGYRNRSRATSGKAELMLSDCRDTSDKNYSCTIDAVTFNGETEPVEQHRAWLQNSDLVPLSVHLFQYSKRRRGGEIVMVRSGTSR